MKNLGLKESLGVKFKDAICAELCLKLRLEMFIILLSQDGESDCPEKKFQTITYQSQFEKVAAQKFIVKL